MKIFKNEYSRDSDNDIFKRMYECIRLDNVELEIVFEKIDKPKFINLLKICKNKFYSISETNTLDITLPVSNIRTSIIGVSSIKKYCKTNKLDDLEVEYMEKKIYDDLFTAKPLYLEEYPVRLNIKTEDKLESTNEDVMILKSKLEKARKYMRYKKRFSFLTYDRMFRIDLTAVKSGEGISLVDSEVLKKGEEYEVEIEFVGKENVENGLAPIDEFIELFYSSDKKIMENYEIIIPKMNVGLNNNSEMNKIEDIIEVKEYEISEMNEYGKEDVDNMIYSSVKKVEIEGELLSLIKQDYWRVSDRLWLYDIVINKNLSIEDIVIGDGDYEGADKDSEYYKVRISPPFTDEELTEELEKLKPEERDTILVDRKYIDQNRESIIKIMPKKRKRVEIDYDRINELEKIRVEDIVIENVLKVLDKYVEYILKIIKEVDILLDYSEKNRIIEIYKDLTNQNGENVRLKGPQPVSISLDEFNPDNNNSILSGYAVTEKADGIRAELLIDEDKRGYLITTLSEKYKNKKIPKIMDTGLYFSGLEGRWLLDGEYITKDKNGNDMNIKMYKIFDVYYAGDGASKYPNDAYKYPWLSSDDISREKILLDFVDSSKIVSIEKDNRLLIDVKKYYYGPSKLTKSKKTNKYRNVTLMGKECKKILNIDKKKIGYGYRIDGLIFLPMYKPVGSMDTNPVKTFGVGTTGGPWYINYKWKPPEENTIDFKIFIMKDKSNNNKISTIYKLEDGVRKAILCYQVKLLVYYDINKDKITDFNKLIVEGKKNKLGKFIEFNPDGENKGLSICNLPVNNNKMLCKNGEEIFDGMILEMQYDMHNKTWIPLRTRPDKPFPQESSVANNIWTTIINPVYQSLIEGQNLDTLEFETKETQEYYVENIKATDVDKPLRDFHNYIKRCLINLSVDLVKNKKVKVLDTSFGRGGDISKYYPHTGFEDKDKSIEFLLGLDISSNINEAARRYYQQYMMKGLAMFIQYDTSKSIISGDGLMRKEDKKYHDILFTDNKSDLNKRYRNLGKKGFDIISSQFSFHYYFKDEDTLRGYMDNISNLLNKGGYFIGTCYDGNKIFDSLKKGDIEMEDELGNLVYSIKKNYDMETFDYDPNDNQCYGKEINVYMSTIGQELPEYLVNFEFVVDIMKEYGLELVDVKSNTLSGNGIGNFENIIDNLESIKEKDKYLKTHKAKDILKMKNSTNTKLKLLSSFNNWFIFQKS